MAIDQRDVSSTLRFMDDRALQQYAAMHKSDPYIFPLAFQESQNRQRLRMGQQGAQGMQPQPKVNDQALAQMAPPQAQPMPEDVGIGALPAGNMQQMADGGIAGYDDADFVSRSEPVVMMAGGGVARYQVGGSIQSRYQQELQEMGMGTRMQYSPEVQAYVRAQEEESKASYAERERQRMLRGPYADAAPAAPQATMPEAGYTRPGMKNDPRLNTPLTQPVVAAPKVDAAPKPDTNRRNITDPSAPRKEPAQATTDLTGMYEQALKKADEKPNQFESQLKAITDEKVKAGEANVSGLEAIQKQFADIYKGRKERLDTREGEIGKMKDQSLGLALLNAGAEMMQTRGSIGQAAGAGIGKFSQQYVAGLDKINAAKDKLSDARDRMEEIEAQRGELSARELHKARNEVKALTVSGMENLVQAAMAERKMNRAEAIAFVEQQIKISEGAKDRSSREGIARLQATSGNRNNQLEMLQALQADPKLMATYRTMQGKNEDVMGQYNDFLKANPALAMDPKAAFTQFLMTKSAFAQLGASPVTEKAAGPVRKQP